MLPLLERRLDIDIVLDKAVKEEVDAMIYLIRLRWMLYATQSFISTQLS